MEELAKFISALPQPASIVFVTMLAIVVGVSWRGILQGRKLDPAKDMPAAQVAAVIVDPTALNAATSALSKHTEAIELQTDMQERMVDKLVDHLERLRDEIRELSREISRRS